MKYLDKDGNRGGQDFYFKYRDYTDKIKEINNVAEKYLNPEFFSDFSRDEIYVNLSYDLNENKNLLLQKLLTDEQNKDLEVKILSFELKEKLSTPSKRNKI